MREGEKCSMETMDIWCTISTITSNILLEKVIKAWNSGRHLAISIGGIHYTLTRNSACYNGHRQKDGGIAWSIL